MDDEESSDSGIFYQENSPQIESPPKGENQIVKAEKEMMKELKIVKEEEDNK